LAVFLLATVQLALVLSSSTITVRASPVDIENRILRAITFLKTHFYNASGFSGFLSLSDNMHGSRIFADENAFMALALSAYQETHFTTGFYDNTKDAVEAVMQLEAPQRDFYQYYDMHNKTFGPSGKLYYWNAYVIMGLGYAAFTVTNQVGSEREYWLPIVTKLRALIDDWIPRFQSQSGAVTFSFPGAPDRSDVALNGALLMGLVNVATFEFLWADKGVAAAYSMYSLRIANWLYGLQETNESTWGFGGFYSNSSKKLQTTLQNSFAMFGLNSWYKAVGLLLPKTYPSLEPMRKVMVAWAKGYEERIADTMGGLPYGRVAVGQINYPETTEAASATLVAMVDVWINLGPPVYWNDSARIYSWLIGHNSQSADLQTSQGNFYAGLSDSGLISTSNLTSTLIALYSFIRAEYVSIPGTYPVPEFTSPVPLLVFVVLGGLVLSLRARRRHMSDSNSLL